MDYFPAPVEELIIQFARLPGIGRKTAARLAFYVLSLDREEAITFARAVENAKLNTCNCGICHNISDSEVCSICASNTRDKSLICVVAEPKDVAAMERAKEYTGVYHVLHGVISPLRSKSPDDLRVKELLNRVNEGGIKEIILATNPDTEGDTTALYIARLLRPFGVAVTRLAHGIPMGGHLEYADEVTLSRALEGRRGI